ncbi:MAG TPA: hypothetical protein VH370_01720 [Humisphaera sp.]|jgi:hypothetical protein|nr:hypothetical protein [Humisphaera sp.]
MTSDFLVLWFAAMMAAGVVIAFLFLANRPKEPRGFPVDPPERKS